MFSRSTEFNWGRFPKIKSEVAHPRTQEKLLGASNNVEHFTPKGNGRSYGDAGLSSRMIFSSHLKRVLSIDEENGIIEAESGLLISELLDQIIPLGLFVPVTPGTQFVSIGGAVAADVHGKNHHSEGSFSKYVDSICLLREGGFVECSRETNTDLFWLSVGGMGITGFIYSVKFKLKRIESSYIKEDRFYATGLDELLDLFEEKKEDVYSVAWLDSASKGKNLGRSVLMTGDHAKRSELEGKPEKMTAHKGLKLAVPMMLPAITLNKWNVGIFNSLYYATHGPHKNAIISYRPFFYPLDMILYWNRIYGGRGFTQYQFVVPYDGAKKAIESVITTVHDFGEASFLTTFKTFGEKTEDAPFSFPMPGYTMAMDFRLNKNVLEMLNKLDDIVLSFGGRLYLAKDCRMSAAMFEGGYNVPRIKSTMERAGLDDKNCSDQLKRLLRL